ncbi:hypothetical protein Bca4012_083609 [Brassica carinata]
MRPIPVITTGFLGSVSRLGAEADAEMRERLLRSELDFGCERGAEIAARAAEFRQREGGFRIWVRGWDRWGKNLGTGVSLGTEEMLSLVMVNLGHEGEGEGEGEGGGKSKQSRSEKKSRKAMLKLGMKPITGVSRDIELVMTQARVPRPRAVKALKAADGDIVSAIMEYSIEVLKT